MTDEQLAQYAAQAEAARIHAATLAKIRAESGITRPELALFVAINYGFTIPPADLPERAVMEDYNPSGPRVTEPECQEALAACLAKSWLHVTDETRLAQIVEELRDKQILGPIYGLPWVGGVDFTPAGAELWHRLSPDDGASPFAYTDVVHIRTAQYFRTRAAALAGIVEAHEGEDVVAVTGPTSIGPWRVQWWRRFAEGYRIDIEEKMHWTGRGGSGGAYSWLPRSFPQADSGRLRHILDCHNLTPAEWLTLSSLEHEYSPTAKHLPRQLAASSANHFGACAAEADCRAGLEACVRNGWVRVVDDRAVAEVAALLRAEPATLLVPSEVEKSPGELGFTPTGATLYRMIMAEWLGSHWEVELSVKNCYYREEHCYSETVEGFQEVDFRYSNEHIRTRRLIPLGPWCVSWWERYPAGYRLELEIGEP